MAGLLDLFPGMGGAGLLGGLGNFANNNQDALLALGLGLASGNTPMEGFKNAIPGLLQGRKSDRERTEGAALAKDIGGMFGAPASPAAAPMGSPAIPRPPASIPGNFGSAIAGIESGGRYDALGPVTKGDRAYGKYQVMGANIGPWTQEVLGRPMTPQEFIANPQAQDAVFQAKFGNYVQKYGPEGAARAWFAGEGRMNNPNAKDILGTTVQGYGQKFMGALGPQAAPAPARPDPVAEGQPGYQPWPPMAGGAIAEAPAPQAPAIAQAAQQAPHAAPQAVPQDVQRSAIKATLGEISAAMLKYPNAPAHYKEFLKEIFKAKLDETKMTDAQKNYQYARVVDGYKGSFRDFQNGPEYGVIGEDEYGKPIRGFIDKNNKQITESQITRPVQQAIPGQPTIPPPPPGVDPKKWRELATEKAYSAVAGKEQKATAANIVVQDIDRALGKVANSKQPITGLAGSVAARIPGTDAFDTSKLMDTVKANAGFDKLNEMRQASPTGGALGSITERELALLQSTIGSLEQSQGTKQFEDNLKRVKNTYLDIIHGKDKGPPREKLSFDKPVTDAEGWQDMGNGIRIRERR